MSEEILAGVHMGPDHEAEKRTNEKILFGCVGGVVIGFIVGALLVLAVWGLVT